VPGSGMVSGSSRSAGTVSSMGAGCTLSITDPSPTRLDW